MVCHSGVGLTPLIQDELHHFSAGGLFNGLVLLIDDETRSYWDHITGECVHGPMKGARMPTWSIEMTNVRAEVRRGDTRVLVSDPGLLGRVMGAVSSPRGSGFFPPGFRGTMSEVDPRLPELAHGLGVLREGKATFYPMSAIGSGLTDGELRIEVDPDDGIPVARVGSERPFQIFSRWYGFSLTWPGCAVYSAPSTGSSEA